MPGVAATKKEKMRNLHVQISDEEWRRLRMVAAHMGVKLTHWVRPLLAETAERECKSRGLGVAIAGRK